MWPLMQQPSRWANPKAMFNPVPIPTPPIIIPHPCSQTRRVSDLNSYSSSSSAYDTDMDIQTYRLCTLYTYQLSPYHHIIISHFTIQFTQIRSPTFTPLHPKRKLTLHSSKPTNNPSPSKHHSCPTAWNIFPWNLHSRRSSVRLILQFPDISNNRDNREPCGATSNR